MRGSDDITAEATRLDELFRAKARAEISAAEALSGECAVVAGQGDELADVALVKGEPGPGDLEAGRALAGPDGEAAGKALDALGLSSSRFAFCTRLPGMTGDARIERVGLMLEALDPRVVIALDRAAADDVLAAYRHPAVRSGVLTRVGGREFLALDGLEASLADPALKRRVWGQMKGLAAPGSST